MALEEILRAMESAAVAERETILSAAQREAEQVAARARSEAEAAGARRLEAELRALRSDQARQLNDARLAGLRAVAAAREGLLAEAFETATTELAECRSAIDYPDVFARLLEETSEQLGSQSLAIRVDPRDESLAMMAISKLGLGASVTASLSCSGGLDAASTAGLITVRNTFEHRLARARELLREELLADIGAAQSVPAHSGQPA